MKDLNVSCSPHLHSPQDTPWIMRQVIYALLPAACVGIYFFGLPALKVIVLAVLFCVATEALSLKLLNKPLATLKDGSAVLTGLLLAMNLPSGAPWWLVMVGSFFAIAFGKMVFGGLGNNPFNPALAGRVFLLTAFGSQMTTWAKPGHFPLSLADTVTGATPLGVLKEQGAGAIDIFKYSDLLIGNIGGCLGEVSAIALLIGGGYLLVTRIISWHIPVMYVLTVAVFTGIMHAVNPAEYAPAMFHVLSGGLLLGAIFMATDMVTSPITNKGKVIFAVGCGIITSLIRLYGGMPEGVSYSILVMNGLVPLINRWSKPVKFGVVK